MRPRLFGLLLAIALIAMTAPVAAVDPDETTPFPWPPSPWLSEPVAEAEPTPERVLPPAAVVVRRGPASSGAVALTFDDGYNSRACSLIANKLRQHDAVGTFFINGQWLQHQPATWRRILEGMEVANHTRSHPRLTREPHQVVINQIRSNEEIHERILGRPMLKAFRPPYGAYGERVGRIARQLGYKHVVMWSVDTQDWRTGAKVKGVIRRATGAAPGSIILMHCGPGVTVKALPHIIKHYQRRGIKLTGLSRVLKGARGAKGGVGSSLYDS